MLAKVLDPGVQAQEFLSAFSPSESLLTALLSPCGTVGLFDDVLTSRRGDPVLVIDVDQTRDLSDRGSVGAELIGMNDLWGIVFSQGASQERLRSLGIAVLLKEDVGHEPVLVHSSPKPVTATADGRTSFVHVLSETPFGFPVAQIFREEGSEFHAPLAERVVTDNNAAPME